MKNSNCPSYYIPTHYGNACANTPYDLPMNILKDHDPPQTMGNLDSFSVAAVDVADAGFDDSESLP